MCGLKNVIMHTYYASNVLLMCFDFHTGKCRMRYSFVSAHFVNHLELIVCILPRPMKWECSMHVDL